MLPAPAVTISEAALFALNGPQLYTALTCIHTLYDWHPEFCKTCFHSCSVRIFDLPAYGLFMPTSSTLATWRTMSSFQMAVTGARLPEPQLSNILASTFALKEIQAPIGSAVVL